VLVALVATVEPEPLVAMAVVVATVATVTTGQTVATAGWGAQVARGPSAAVLPPPVWLVAAAVQEGEVALAATASKPVVLLEHADRMNDSTYVLREVLARCLARGVELKWFGAEEPVGFTSRYDSWRYAPVPQLPRTDRVLAGLVDMRLPLTFSLEDCALIARIIRAEVGAVWQAGATEARGSA
jgi:hypothetical protein